MKDFRITPTDLARNSDIKRNHYYSIMNERIRLTPRMLGKLCKGLGIELDVKYRADGTHEVLGYVVYRTLGSHRKRIKKKKHGSV